LNTALPALPIEGVRALSFDIFGTVVDWYGSIAAEVAAMGLPVDGGEFALAWRAGYQPAMQDVRSGALPWTTIDGLHRRILDRILAERGVVLPEADAARLNLVWHRLQPWPDSVAGLTRLKARYTITSLSNGNVALLVNMAKHAGLPWDTVLSAELFQHYKPDPEVYLGAARLLGLQPHELMMAAAHPGDLRAAAACGLRTAYVARPLERGPGGTMEPWQEGEFDIAAGDIGDLAARLGA
jgi:2-haloacid dehalogenase